MLLRWFRSVNTFCICYLAIVVRRFFFIFFRFWIGISRHRMYVHIEYCGKCDGDWKCAFATCWKTHCDSVGVWCLSGYCHIALCYTAKWVYSGSEFNLKWKYTLQIASNMCCNTLWNSNELAKIVYFSRSVVHTQSGSESERERERERWRTRVQFQIERMYSVG